MNFRSLLGPEPVDNTAHASRRARLDDLANQVTHGLRNFARAGAALAEIRDAELYKCTHTTFEAFCLERWKLSRQHAYRLIDAATIARTLSPTGTIPQTERQVRPLAALPAEQRNEAWAEASTDGAPTTAAVERAVRKRLPKRRRRGRPRPLRLRVPGGTITIDRKSAAVDPTAMLDAARAALAKLHDQAA